MINKVLLLGRCGKDPEVRTFNNGDRVANFSLATSDIYRNKDGERVENTEWHNISVFGKTVDIVEKYVTKGSLIHIEGKLKTRSWEVDGVKKYITEVVLEKYGGKITLLPKSTSNESEPESVEAEMVTDDDLPF